MTVWTTIENMRKLDCSVHSFFEILERRLFSEDLRQIKFTYWRSESRSTRNGWCYFAEYNHYFLRKMNQNTGRFNNAGVLTVAIELCREIDPCSEWKHAREPLIYVGFHHTRNRKPNDYWSYDYMALSSFGEPFEREGILPPNEERPALWIWDDGNANREWDMRSWFFALQMFDIDTPNAVDHEIIHPLNRLLIDNSDAQQVFAERKALHA